MQDDTRQPNDLQRTCRMDTDAESIALYGRALGYGTCYGRPEPGWTVKAPAAHTCERWWSPLEPTDESIVLTATTRALLAVRDRLDDWQYPVAIVQFRDGDCETIAVPDVHLTDITWLDRGREHVVVNRLDRDDVAELLAIADEEGDAHADR
jgi:hypothetical protein